MGRILVGAAILSTGPSTTGCAPQLSTAQTRFVTAAVSDLKVATPAEARRSCLDVAAPLPVPPPGKAALAGFGVGQTGALEICDERRKLAVANADLHDLYVDRLAEAMRPATLAERVLGKRRKPPPRPTLDELEGISLELAGQGDGGR